MYFHSIFTISFYFDSKGSDPISGLEFFLEAVWDGFVITISFFSIVIGFVINDCFEGDLLKIPIPLLYETTFFK